MLSIGFSNGRAQLDRALQDSLRRECARHPADTSRVRALNSLARTYAEYNPDSMNYYAEEALQLAGRLGDQPGIAKALVIRCAYLIRRGDFSTALDRGLEGLRLFEALHLESGMAYACLMIAQAYKEIGGGKHVEAYLREGIAYAKRCYILYAQLNDTAEMVSGLNEEGIIYRDLAKGTGDGRYYDTALSGYLLGLRLIQSSGKGKDNLGHLYNNISAVYTEHQRDYPTALQYLQKAVALNEGAANIKSLSYNYGYMAHIYHQMGDGRRSLQYALKTLALAKRIGYPDRLENAYIQLQESYMDVGRYDSALYYSTIGHDIGDSLTNLDRTRQIAEMQTKYESARKEVEIQRLNTDNSNKNRQILLLVGGLGAVFLVAGAFFWLYRRVGKQKRVISRQATQLETVMKELHHRVKNNLQIVSSLLSLQAYKLNDEDARAAIRQSQLRVQAMSFIHQRLYKTDEATQVNIKEYLSDLSESLLSSYGYDRDQFDLRITAEQELLDVDKVLMLGLIANEVITNALKYAYRDVPRPSLWLVCTGDEAHFTLSIKDNGPGLDVSVWKGAGGSFGKQLVATLCKQLKATQELAIDDGTRFTFTIPRHAQVA